MKSTSWCRRWRRAYLAVRGNTFNHLGVQLPLDQEVLTMAIQNNIVALIWNTLAANRGEDALLMLRHMLAQAMS